MNSPRATLRMIVIYLLLACVLPHPVQAEAAAMIGLEELQSGMRGTVRSVLQGVKVASFDVQLQGIIEGPVAGNKYLLLKVEDDDLRLGSGFSGSPVYFDGRLAGAISHMEKNLARQMVMAVPIARMMEDAARSGVASLPAPVAAELPEPGSMIALPLVRGDIWLGSSGTLTYADKGILLAFGHEHLFSGNTVQVPIHRALVHGVIPKTDMSHKEASPLEEIGSVVWDGKAAIVGKLGGKAAMTPLLVTCKPVSGPQRTYTLEMLNNTRLAPALLSKVVQAVASAMLPNRPGGTDLELVLQAQLGGMAGPVTINQRFNLQAIKADASSPNPFELLLNALLLPLGDSGRISSLSIQLTELPDARSARIAEAVFSMTRARAGETVPLRVRLSGPYGELRDLRIPVTIPADYTEKRLTVSVHPGLAVRPAEHPPATQQEIPAWLAAVARSDDLVVLLPGSMIDRVYPDARLTRAVGRAPWNVEGSAEASITVLHHD